MKHVPDLSGSAGDGDEHRLSMLDGLLAAAVEHAVMMTDRAGMITFLSHGAEVMLGYQADELVGRSGLSIADPAEIARIRLARQPISGSLNGNSPTETYRRDWRWVRKDGTNLTVSAALAHVRDASGTPIG